MGGQLLAHKGGTGLTAADDRDKPGLDGHVKQAVPGASGPTPSSASLRETRSAAGEMGCV